ncbi:MAG: hypothetical protein HWN65_19255 [Candidatus Helarchaeota archaeon]|nr:hypothetical protein [Candidatus Helarchaeota archaeon]
MRPNKMEKIEHYINQSKVLLKNANLMVKKQEYNKAGEMLWGAMTSLLKAIGIMHNKPIRNHKEIIKVAKFIALIKNDKELNEAIVNSGQTLHANFYENFLDLEVFKEHQEKVIKGYNTLFKIILESKVNNKVISDELE